MRAMKDSGIKWIGEIPQNWLTKKLKYCVDLRLEKTADKASSASYIGLEHVSSFTGTLCEDYEAITDFNGDTLDFCEGDVLFGKLRPYLAKAYQAKDNGRCSSEFWAMNPTRIEGRYLLYYVLSHGFISDIDHSTFGVKMPRAEWDYAGNEKMPLPTQEEQLRIVSFLDTKCAEIDALIAAKEKTNALLKERRQSIIYEAVTKGLDPTIPMKDSGVEWIGEIPEGWSTWRMKHLAVEPLQYGANATGIEFDSELPRYVRITDITQDRKLNDEGKQSLPESIARDYMLEPGDILFARSGATSGKSFYYQADYGRCCFAGYLIRFRPDIGKANSKFLYYFTLTQPYEQWTQQIFIQATIQNISAEKYNNLVFAIPPTLEEQEKIVSYLDSECGKIEKIIQANEFTIQQLKEYRQSLIYEAVTGKIEV